MAKRYGSWLSKRRGVAPKRLSCPLAPKIFPAAAMAKITARSRRLPLPGVEDFRPPCRARQTRHRGGQARRHTPSQFPSHSLLFTAVHGRPSAGHPCCQGRSRTVADGDAQSSKACEGATPPWVQIPPPPPLTCKNTGLDSRQAGASCSPGLIWWSQLRAACGPTAGLSRSCRTWSRAPRTGPNEGAHAAGSCTWRFTEPAALPRPGTSAMPAWPGAGSAAARRLPLL
jgi:hypothetical protein